MDEFIKKIPKIGKIYKSIDEAYGALLKGFRSIEKRDPNAIENKMIQAEAKNKIKSQGDNISIFPEEKQKGIMSVSQAPGMIKTGEVLDVSFKPGVDKRGKRVEESPSQATGPDLKSGIIRTDVFDDFGDVTIEGQGDKLRNIIGEESIEAYTKALNDKKLFRAEGIIKKLGAKTDKQKMFVADIVDDIKQGVYQRNDVGASIKSHMYDDLLEQGLDDDTVLNIMYRDTEADDFSTTMAKIKGNAKDKGINIDDTVDFYENTYFEVGKPRDLKAYGGRMGFADGPDDPKKKSLVKKIPKVGKLVSGVESLKGAIGKIMNKFGEDAITTADKVDQPEKTTQQLISEFEARNKPDAIKIESREILDVPPVPEGFKLSKEKLLENFPEIDEDMADQIMELDKDTQGRVLMMIKNRRQDPEAYDKLLETKGDTLEFQGEFDKVTRRKNNNRGGLNYLMGL